MYAYNGGHMPGTYIKNLNCAEYARFAPTIYQKDLSTDMQEGARDLRKDAATEQQRVRGKRSQLGVRRKQHER